MKRGSGGVRVLGVLFVDLERGLIELEWIEGMTARKILGGGGDDELPEEEVVGDDEEDLSPSIWDRRRHVSLC